MAKRPIASFATDHADRWTSTTGYPAVPREEEPADPADVLLAGLSVDEHLAAVGRELRARGAATATVFADIDVVGGRGLVLRPPTAVPARAVLLRSVDFSLPVPHHGRRSFVRVDPFDRGDPVHGHATREAAAALQCWADLIEAPRWINDPWANRRADSKALQLRVAHHHGFAVPDTLVTTSRAEAASFAAAQGGIIHKAMNHPLIGDDEERSFLHTSVVAPMDLEDRAGSFAHPVLLQKQLTPRVEYRATVVGQQVLSARLEVMEDGAGEVDWRRGLGTRRLRVAPVNLGPETDRALVAIVAALGLGYAAVDLLEDDGGVLHFLEVNPSGSYLWVEEAAGLPITGALVDELLEGAG